jgi:hypothetical protein
VPFGADAFGFDGARIAWTTVECESTTIHVRAPGDPPVPSARRSCPLRLAGPLRRRGRALTLRVSCTGFAARCDTSRVMITLRAGPTPIVVAKRGPSRPAESSVPLTAAGRRLARMGRPLRLTIEADQSGFNGRTERRRTTQLIRL